MMLLLAVVCTLFVFSEAQPAPQHCCIPDKWEGHSSTLGGFYKDSSTVGKIHVSQRQHYDATDKKYADEFHVTINDEEPGTRGKFIIDFDAMKHYMIDADNKCTSHALTGSFERYCIPADAKHIGRQHYGGGGHMLNVDDWNITVGSLNLHMHVTVQGCYPVLATIQGSADSTQFVGGRHWSDITDGIADPKIFEPPAGCTPGADLGDVDMFGVLGTLFPKYPQMKHTAPKLPRFDRL